MLPNRMQLDRTTEEQLKKIKSYTGLTPNITARIAFFKSIESGFKYYENGNSKKLDGNLILDKITWLGETLQLTELTLKMQYPTIEHKEMVKVWAAHVEDGISSIRNHRSLNNFCQAL
ncbi:DNA sulfur modification protein DndE [Lelliottia amnigena]|jgi:DNA sulfur modification protein DndE|uniref:DNA sulfur modification protein DndE n=1 Tax=Lelliottia amnigena TaxID=61646 RepID=UPI00293BDC6E|nr:DNA sulfur modification protein DndE [Lelliottia amnigena]